MISPEQAFIEMIPTEVEIVNMLITLNIWVGFIVIVLNSGKYKALNDFFDKIF